MYASDKPADCQEYHVTLEYVDGWHRRPGLKGTIYFVSLFVNIPDDNEPCPISHRSNDLVKYRIFFEPRVRIYQNVDSHTASYSC